LIPTGAMPTDIATSSICKVLEASEIDRHIVNRRGILAARVPDDITILERQRVWAHDNSVFGAIAMSNFTG